MLKNSKKQNLSFISFIFCETTAPLFNIFHYIKSLCLLNKGYPQSVAKTMEMKVGWLHFAPICMCENMGNSTRESRSKGSERRNKLKGEKESK